MFKNYKSVRQYIGNKRYTLFIAETDQQKLKGLKYIKSIPKDCGMIFPYAQEEAGRIFTMKDVNFPLKIIFLDKTENIVYSVVARPGQRIICEKPSMFVIEIPV